MILRDYQKECVDIVDTVGPGSFLIALPTGTGKCFAKDTKILMYDGSIKNVQDICVGENVMGWDSKPRTVESLANGFEMMYEVKRNRHNSYTVNESHILSLKITGMGKTKIVTDSRGNRYKKGDIVNISVKDYLDCSITFKHCAKGFCVPVNFKKQKVSVDPYFLGVWLGDGNSRSFKFTVLDDEIKNYLFDFAKNNDFEITIPKNQNSGKATDYYLRDYKHNEIRKYFSNNLFKNKHIPNDYIYNSREIRLRLLAGLLDTDGYLADDNTTFEFSTMYEHMSKSVEFIAKSLGLRAKAFSRYNKTYERDYYYCAISGKTEIIPTLIKRKQAINKPNKNALMHGIVLENKGIGEYFGFTLSGKDRMFLLSDFTVVHNTATFTNFKRHGKTLVLAHREELINQPIKYYDCPVGVEMAGQKSNGEEVVIASVQSLVRRLDRFSPYEFDRIISDEAHHSTAATYMKIYDHFKFRQHIGVTATPNRHDKTGLENVYSKIIFERSLKWAIQEGFLTNIDCLRVDIKYDLSQVSTRLGDFAQNELAEAMDETAEAIADVYKTKARGQTLIFATSVKHAYDIAEHIDGAVVVEANTQNRSDIIERFTRREIPCLINCMIFTEGTDIPLIETIIIARPTQNVSLYTQMVGRGLRLYEGKEKLLLIDCVGVTRTNNLCTAPSLIGLSIRELQKAQQDEIIGDLFDLEDLIIKKSDNVKNWILNAKFVDIWAKEQSYNTHDMNLFKLPNGDMICQLPERVKFTIPAPNELGITVLGGQQVPMQQALDRLYNRLRNDYQEQKYVWDKQLAQKSWGKAPASDKQMKIIQKKVKGEKIEQLTKFEASLILNRLYA